MSSNMNIDFTIKSKNAIFFHLPTNFKSNNVNIY